jgi:hypothetical protein
MNKLSLKDAEWCRVWGRAGFISHISPTKGEIPDFLYVALGDGHACGFHRRKPHETYERHQLHRNSGVWGTPHRWQGQESSLPTLRAASRIGVNNGKLLFLFENRDQSPASEMAEGPLPQALVRSQPRMSEIWSARVKGSKGLERMAAAPSSSSLRRSWPCTLAVSRSTGM